MHVQQEHVKALVSEQRGIDEHVLGLTTAEPPLEVNVLLCAC